jgi:transcriptional regulator NrdR family protein
VNCPLCGAHTYVLDTRSHGALLKRRRECGNKHKFVTLEVFPAMVGSRELAAANSRIQHAVEIWRRDERIRADTRSIAEIAWEYKLSDTRIRQIKSAVQAVPAWRKPRSK